MNSYYLAIGILGAILLNIIASFISKNWSLTTVPQTTLWRAIAHIYLVGVFVLACLHLFLHFRASWFIAFAIGGQILWQLITAARKILPNKGVQGTAHKVRCPLTPDVRLGGLLWQMK